MNHAVANVGQRNHVVLSDALGAALYFHIPAVGLCGTVFLPASEQSESLPNCAACVERLALLPDEREEQ